MSESAEPPRCHCGAALQMDGTCPYPHEEAIQMDLSGALKHVEAAIEARVKTLVEDVIVEIDDVAEEVEKLIDLGMALAEGHDGTKPEAPEPVADAQALPASPSTSTGGTATFQAAPTQAYNATGTDTPGAADAPAEPTASEGQAG